ncbi:SpoIIIAC/SpoIIIAD family protein [Flavonifractor hominis]|uniref:SpoIIIAC/SpoIIIAD family protein n=1 Tax=Flavonifractor hominis TaxID=3133178 RepID=A0ABV1ELU6_9FIRM
MDSVLKVVAVAVTAAVCAVVVKQDAKGIGMVLAMAAGALVLGLSLGAVESVRALMDDLTAMAGLAPAIVDPVVKTVGIAILTRIAAEVCRDAGEGGLAAFTETAGAAMALLVTLPLLRSVLDTLTGLL